MSTVTSKELADAIGVLETSFNHGRDEILVAALVLKRHIQTNAPETGVRCAHCPAPAVVDITLGDPINYSLSLPVF